MRLPDDRRRESDLWFNDVAIVIHRLRDAQSRQGQDHLDPDRAFGKVLSGK